MRLLGSRSGVLSAQRRTSLLGRHNLPPGRRCKIIQWSGESETSAWGASKPSNRCLRPAPIPLLWPGTKAESQWKLSASAASRFSIAGSRSGNTSSSCRWRFGAWYGSVFLAAGLRPEPRPPRKSSAQLREASKMPQRCETARRRRSGYGAGTSFVTSDTKSHETLSMSLAHPRPPRLKWEADQNSWCHALRRLWGPSSALSPSACSHLTNLASHCQAACSTHSFLRQLGHLPGHTAFQDARGIEG
jgi:hypothetical protein